MLVLLLCLIAGFTPILGLNFSQTLTAAPCTRLLTGYSTIGCQSNVVSGPIYLAQAQTDIDTLLQNATLNLKYAVVMASDLFTPQNVANMKASGKLTGIGILASPRPAFFSPEKTCPSCEYGLYQNDSFQYQWNPNGNGLSYENFDFPIFGVGHTNDSLNEVLQSGIFNQQHGNIEFPLYGLEFDAYMWGVQDSETCLRRGYCDPIGGRSVWSAFQNPQTSPPTILVTANLDSTAFFRDLAPGQSAYTSSIAALLGVAQALAMATPSSFEQNVLFTLFDAQAWGFSGSDRFVQEVTTFNCQIPASPGCQQPYQVNLDFLNIKIDDIQAIIELGEISGLQSVNSGILYAHVDDAGVSGALAQTLINVADAIIPNSEYSTSFLRPAFNSTHNNKLPPSATQSFLKYKRDIPSVVLAEYETQFANKYYYSSFDNINNVNPNRSLVLCDAARVVARAVYMLANPGATVNQSEIINVNCEFISTVLDCLTQNFSCPLITNFLITNGITTVTHYCSIFYFGKIGPLSAFVHEYLYNLTAVDRDGPCPCSNSSYTCVGDMCLISYTNYHDAYPIGIEYNYNLQRFAVVNPNSSAFTESQWQYTTLTIFLMEGTPPQIGYLMAGIIILLLSIVISYFSQKYIEKTLKIA